MEYRKFGRTGLDISVLSLGGMRFMQSWDDVLACDISEKSQGNIIDVLEKGFSLGINHIETARGYGSSERQLGEALQKFNSETYILQTKVAPEADVEIFENNVLDSLSRLQVERVDLLAFHGINTYEKLWQVCRPKGCLAVARKLQKEGRVGWVGFSGHGPMDIILEAVCHDQDSGFDYLNIHWYTIFQRHDLVLREAERRDMGVFIISPTDKGGMLYSPPEILRDLSSPLSPIQFNDLFCLQKKGVHTISVGASKSSDFDEHINALDFLTDYSLIKSIYSKWEHQMMKKTGAKRPDISYERFPSYDQVPGMINIQMIVWLYNLVKGWDLLEYARGRYALIGKESQWVPGNNGAIACEVDFSDFAKVVNVQPGQLRKLLEEAHQVLSGE